jgi:hypothetical protein
MIVDAGEFVQPLTSTEIEALKKTGLHASVRSSFPSFLLSHLLCTWQHYLIRYSSVPLLLNRTY